MRRTPAGTAGGAQQAARQFVPVSGPASPLSGRASPSSIGDALYKEQHEGVTLRPDDGSPPDRRTARQRLDRVLSAVRSAPLPVKIVLVLALLAVAVVASAVPARVGDLVLVLALGYGPVAIWRRQRSVLASLGVAVWGEAAILFVAALTNSVTLWLFPLLLLPFAVVAAAHSPPLARNLVPCRTVAWTL